MDWDKLKIFHAVAEAGSFTSATVNLNLSQSAISRQIQSLEDDLNVKLFERHARGLTLTENGEYVFKTAHEVISKLKEVSNNIEDITVPFDKMLSESNDSPGRIAAEKTVNNLLALAENFKKAGRGLNWQGAEHKLRTQPPASR